MTLERALAAGTLVTDGALGTLGFARGLTGPPTLWTLDRPDAVEAMHRAYVDAGARLVVTNTFGASRAWLASGVDLATTNASAVALARAAAGDAALVVGDVGPSGLGDGEGSFERAADIVREQAAALVGAGVDAILVETMSSLGELRAAVLAANDVRGRVPVIASMTFGDDGRTATGATPRDLAELAAELGVAAVGANCSYGPASLLGVVRELVARAAVPVIARPNAGLPERPIAPNEVVAGLVALVDTGARIVGGCCGTTPDTIRAFTDALSLRG